MPTSRAESSSRGIQNPVSTHGRNEIYNIAERNVSNECLTAKIGKLTGAMVTYRLERPRPTHPKSGSSSAERVRFQTH
jgi:hypothetical protein